MTFLLVELRWSRNNEITGESFDILLTDWTRISLKKGLDAKSNTLEVTLKNGVNRVAEDGSTLLHKYVTDSTNFAFEQNDVLTLRAKRATEGDAVLTEDDVLTVADVIEWEYSLEAKRSTVRVKAVDKTFNLLNSLVARSYTLDDGLTSADIIRELVQEVSDLGDGTGTFGIATTLQTEGTYEAQRTSATPGIQTKRIDDSDFPVTSIAKVYKPVYEWIDELSELENTNDFNNRNGGGAEEQDNPPQNRKMRYYVDKDSNFRWFYPDDSVDYTIAIGTVSAQQEDVVGYKLRKSVFDVVNFVIFNSGQDLFGSGTLFYYYDETSDSAKLSPKYKAYNEISRDVIQQEINNGNLVEAASGAFTFQGNRYDASGYNITTSWGDVVSDDAEYNDSLRNEAIRRGTSRAQAFTRKRGSPRLKGTIDIKGFNFVAGEVINLTSVPHGIGGRLVRINDITHNITKGGWLSSVSVEEDEPKVGGS